MRDVTLERLKVLHVNVQSIFNKFGKLEILCADQNPKILCLSDHWGMPGTEDTMTLPGYTLVASFFRDVRKHGGVVIYTSTDFVAHPV